MDDTAAPPPLLPYATPRSTLGGTTILLRPAAFLALVAACVEIADLGVNFSLYRASAGSGSGGWLDALNRDWRRGYPVVMIMLLIPLGVAALAILTSRSADRPFATRAFEITAAALLIFLLISHVQRAVISIAYMYDYQVRGSFYRTSEGLAGLFLRFPGKFAWNAAISLFALSAVRLSRGRAIPTLQQLVVGACVVLFLHYGISSLFMFYDMAHSPPQLRNAATTGAEYLDELASDFLINVGRWASALLALLAIAGFFSGVARRAVIRVAAILIFLSVASFARESVVATSNYFGWTNLRVSNHADLKRTLWWITSAAHFNIRNASVLAGVILVLRLGSRIDRLPRDLQPSGTRQSGG